MAEEKCPICNLAAGSRWYPTHWSLKYAAMFDCPLCESPKSLTPGAYLHLHIRGYL